MPVRTMSSQSHTRRVESEELYKELPQGIDISAFFTSQDPEQPRFSLKLCEPVRGASVESGHVSEFPRAKTREE